MSRSGPSINVECDGCGEVLEVELPEFKIDHDRVVDALLEKLHWHVTEAGDFCPDCSGKEVCEDCGEHVDYTEHCLNCCMKVCADCQQEHDEEDCGAEESKDDDGDDERN